jgi:hypothetical protein
VGRGFPIAVAAALAAAGCASLPAPVPPVEDEPAPAARMHGILALTLSAPVADGRVLVEGVAESSGGSHRAFGVGVLGEARSETFFASLESTFVGLPSQLDLDVSGDDEHQRTEYRHTEVCLGPELVQGGAVFGSPAGKPLSITPFVGGRFSRFVVRESPLGDGHGEAWSDFIAGARVETRLGSGVVLRLKGDTLVGGRSDEAWRASAAVVFGGDEVRVAAGFECLSVEFEGDSGIERVRYDVFLGGPFVAIEVWF